MPKKIYEVATMDIVGKLINHRILEAETWLEARNKYQKKFGGNDIDIFVREIK